VPTAEPTPGGAEWFRDPGGQNERTSLAWQRTALSIAAGSAILARLTFADIGVWALAVFGVSLVLSTLTLVSTRWEYRRRATLPAPRLRLHQGTRAALLTANVLILCLAEIAALNVS
jgi:uncharacterized membrane protein YidH (DUF202 family)